MAQAGTEGHAAQASDNTGWRRWVPAFGTVSATFTALCCLGISAALSLSTAVGATFLTRDSTLKPILAATLAVTIAGSILTSWRTRRVGPLILTILAAAWIYAFIFVNGGTHTGHTPVDHMADNMAEDVATQHGHGLSDGRVALVWVGLALLIGAQVWDFVRTHRSYTPPDR